MSAYWQASVYYGEHSSNHFGAESEDEARTMAVEEAARLRETGAVVKRATVQWFCVRCDGKGTVWVPNNRARAVGKTVPCPICLGMASKGPVVEVEI